MTQPDDDKTRTFVPLTNDTMVSHYRIVEKIGAGGMGEVYLAEDTKLDRRVALKFLPLHLCQDPECRARFTREAQASAKLDHPNVVSVFEVGEFQGRPFFSMQHVEGQTLKEVLSRRALPLDRVLEIGIQVCEGLQAAHDRGITHRDIKPSNILVDSHGRARIVDFGLASVMGSDHLTKTGSTLGTVGYMSPEQVRGDKVDHRTDLFSFGVVLYEMITGHAPFKADSEAATLHAITDATPEVLARFRREVPPELQTIVDKALDKKVETRHQHADDIATDLRRLAQVSQFAGGGVPQKPTRSRVSLVVGAVMVAVLAVSAVIFFKLQKPSMPVANSTPMIAVLPFENLGSPDDEYFADGMTEEITSRLAGIAGLGVISRTSVLQFKGSKKSIGQIGKELGVSYILEGTVRWAKEGGQARVRITPQLIRVSDDRHMWTDIYERALMEVFAVQEDIATKIVNQLDVTLLETERRNLAVRPTTNAKAYEYYLKGISSLRGAGGDAVASFDSAVTLDSSFALAWAGRSCAYSALAALGSSSDMGAKIARESFEKALQLEPNLSYGHMAAGIYYNLVETDYDKALSEFDRAFSELKGDAELLTGIALVQWRQGRLDEAADNYSRAAELDPLNAAVHATRASFLGFQQQFHEAEQSINRAIALEPKVAYHYMVKINSFSSRYGDWGKIREVIREALTNGVDSSDVITIPMQWDWMPFGLSPDSMFAGLNLQIDSFADKFRAYVRPRINADEYYAFTTLAGAYRAAGNAVVAKALLDTARIELKKHLSTYPDDPHGESLLGLILAEQGFCNEAIEAGIRGKELLSIAKCHW
ncbi:MAG: protein kinase [candidate division Zixibacteria bacterium]|nr:protein kinase [candidate division Zixibacteria bacterium]